MTSLVLMRTSRSRRTLTLARTGLHISWGRLLARLAVHLKGTNLERELGRRRLLGLSARAEHRQTDAAICELDMQTLRLQFEASGLIQTEYSPHSGDQTLWLTAKGRRVLMEIQVVRTQID